MIGMQYKIILPKDYDMGIIRKRVDDNGHKTDGFPGLHFKAYLITEENKNGNLYNCYAPLYVWNNSQGINHFIFGGYYDNILKSFGWQHISIGVPLSINLDKGFYKSRYVLEYEGNIPETNSLNDTPLTANGIIDIQKSMGSLIIYNPDKWRYSQFHFFQDKPEMDSFDSQTLYEILHVSQ